MEEKNQKTAHKKEAREEETGGEEKKYEKDRRIYILIYISIKSNCISKR